MKYKKILAVFLTVLMALAAVSFSAYALTWDGSSAGGSTNAVNGSATGYVIRSTNDSNCVVGYRFSVVNESGAMKVNKVIDVFRKTGNGETARTTSAKFTTKYNKKQLIAHKDSKLVTSQNTTNCYKEADMKFVSDLPNPSGIETWQAYEGNINKVLTKIGVGTTSNMLYGDKVIIEPLFDVCLAGEYQALTVSEIAYCGRSVKGGSSDGGTSTGNSSTWGFIANYTNRIWPNKLFTPDGQGLWDGVSAIASSSKATFNTILTKGYGAGIGYNETNRQKLTIAYDCYGSNVKINTSEGYSLGSYNRLCSTTKTNKTIGGTAHVYYHTLEYNKAIGGSGLHNFSTFGLTAPTGYIFSGWKGPKGVFDEKTTTYKPTDFTDDIKSGDATIWLSAQFKPITYTVKYNGNGNTGGSTASSTHTYDVSKALTANGFTKTGHTFAGWNTNTSGTGTNYSNKQSVVNLTATNGATVNLYAKWTPNKYTVTYNANGGTGAPGNQTKTYGVDLTLSSTKPTRSGYTFNGWNTNSGGTGTNYASGGKYTGNANLTLYAKWTPIPVYTIAYNANGGTGTMSSHTTTSSATIKDNAFSKTGYTFDGWIVQRNDSKYYHSDGTGWTTATTGTRKYNSGESHNFSSASWRYESGTSGTLLSGNRTFTFIAQWKPVTYTVSYNANGGTGAPGNQTKTHGVNLTLSSTKPTRTGYTFNGWNTNSSGTGTNYTSGGTYSANASVTLYAKWTPNTYTVKYYLDGVEQTGLRQSCTYGTSYNYKPLPTKTGYTVSGWWSGNSSASKGTQYTPGASFSNLTSTNGGTVNRYAYTDAKSYTVKYFLDGTEQTSLRQTCTYGVSYTYKSLPTKTGYNVTGWWAGSSSSNKGMQYTAGSSFSNLTATSGGTVNRYAYSTPITYQVKFNGNGSTSGSMSNQSFTYNVAQNLSTNAFKRTFTVTYNYNGNGQSNTTAIANATFDGWAKTSTGAKVYSDRQNVINLSSVNGAVVNVYAKWIDASVTLPTPTRTGYVFSGWYTSSSSGTKVGSGGASYTPSANITLYAHWTPITYTVKYNGNGYTGGSTASSTHTYDVAKNLTANGFTRTGYRFVNWNTKADGSGTTYTNQQSVKNLTATNGATINLYAQWTPITYTISFNGNGNTGGSTASMSMTYDVAKNLTANGFSRTGYIFNGWNTKADGTGTSYTDKQSVKNLSSTQGATVTLYAKWTPITYTVKYNANGGTGTTASSTHIYDVAKNLTANSFTKTGYIFKSWNTKADGTGTSYTDKQSVKNLTTTNGAIINLYAQWMPITYTIKFDGNGNTSGSTASMTMTYDEAKALTANGFVRTGYTFTSWSIEKNGQGACYADKQQVKNMTTVNGAVITLYAQWEENRKLSLEAITPNAAYREKTDVITSFNIINEGINDCVPDDNVSVVFKVYKDSTVIKTVTKNKVVVPGNEKNLIYFKWTVPENIGSSTIYISGEIVENGSSYSFIKNSYATCKYNVYTTPDTQYEANAPENFVKPTIPSESKPEMKWSVWEYTEEGFVKKNYGLAFSVSTPVITPAANSNSTRENGFWIMKSGYSFEMSFHNGVRAITGYTIPTADAFTWPQYSVAKFPEFSYLGTNGNCKTLELVGSDWVFRQNADYGRVHFSPLWYPDGEYTVTIQQSDMWTPAGMITQKVNTNQIKIKGSAYDDWYI